MMFIKKPKTSRILARLRALAKQQDATAYTIAKSSGMPVANIHRMLNNHISIPIRNLEMLIDALGLTFEIEPKTGATRPSAAKRVPGKRPRASAKRRTR